MSLESVTNPTRITVRPDAEQQDQITRPRKAFQIQTLGDREGSSWGGDGFGFDDFVDLINPLQHIPVVNQVYRELTGDTIAQEAQILGSVVLGGPIGLAAATVNAVIQQETGNDMGGNVMALITGSGGTDPDGETITIKPQTVEAPQELMDMSYMTDAPTPLPATLPVTQPAPALNPLNFESLDKKDESKPAPIQRGAPSSKHDVIMDLFGDASSAYDEYKKAQALTHLYSVDTKLSA